MFGRYTILTLTKFEVSVKNEVVPMMTNLDNTAVEEFIHRVH